MAVENSGEGKSVEIVGLDDDGVILHLLASSFELNGTPSDTGDAGDRSRRVYGYGGAEPPPLPAFHSDAAAAAASTGSLSAAIVAADFVE